MASRKTARRIHRENCAFTLPRKIRSACCRRPVKKPIGGQRQTRLRTRSIQRACEEVEIRKKTKLRERKHRPIAEGPAGSRRAVKIRTANLNQRTARLRAIRSRES